MADATAVRVLNHVDFVVNHVDFVVLENGSLAAEIPRLLREIGGSVFLSTAREDRELACGIIGQLRRYNIGAFHYLYQNTLPAGEPWKPALFRKIVESRIFVPVLSRAYWRSVWCRREYLAALALRRTGRLTVIPCILHPGVRVANR